MNVASLPEKNIFLRKRADSSAGGEGVWLGVQGLSKKENGPMDNSVVIVGVGVGGGRGL